MTSLTVIFANTLSVGAMSGHFVGGLVIGIVRVLRLGDLKPVSIYPLSKTENSLDLDHYSFWEEPKFTIKNVLLGRTHAKTERSHRPPQLH